MKRKILALLIATALTGPLFGTDEEEPARMQNTSPLSLITSTPEKGFQLAIQLARKGVTETQPDKAVLKQLRPVYAGDPDGLIAASQVIAIHFQTVAAANDYWRGDAPKPQ